MEKIDFYSANDGRTLSHSVDFTGEVDLTVQSDAIDADINTLVRRFGLTVDSPVDPATLQHYGDFSGLVDFHTATQQLLDAQNAFNELPSAVRYRFRNDPGELLEFIHDPQNAKEAAKLGLLTKEAANALLNPDPPPVDATGSPSPKVSQKSNTGQPAPNPDSKAE